MVTLLVIIIILMIIGMWDAYAAAARAQQARIAASDLNLEKLDAIERRLSKIDEKIS